MDDEPSTRRSRRAVLGLAAGTLAGLAGCTETDDGLPRMGAGTATSPGDGSPTDTPGPGTGTPDSPGSPDGTPTPVDPADLRVTGASVQASALRRHVTGGFLSLRRADGWLVYVGIGTDRGTPDRTDRAFRSAPGYPEAGALELRVGGGGEVAYEAVRDRNYWPVGDARGAWTAFELPAGRAYDSATVAWPAADVTLGELSTAAVERLRGEPPAFTLESFVAGDRGTTPAPSPHGSPTPTYGDHPSTTVDYELRVRNEGGAGRFRGFLDHETPKERFTADYSQGGVRIAADLAAGETRTLTGSYRVFYGEDDPVVPVRAVTAGGEATSRVATGE